MHNNNKLMDCRLKRPFSINLTHLNRNLNKIPHRDQQIHKTIIDMTQIHLAIYGQTRKAIVALILVFSLYLYLWLLDFRY